jgi:hypothetical protein
MASKALHDSIINLLNANSRKSPMARCDCGDLMKPHNAIFVYAGQRWEVMLQLCYNCHPPLLIESDGTNEA